ncbi:dienelactone hydrolase family protein [Rhizobium sp. NZLR10]|uniref:dienelactone hydrolase family protein n=1 Tax=Rhizobium sp. NZLR10 TaxID=2731097 RepID=UPI0038FBF906
MGAGVSAHLWPKRPQMVGLLLLQGLAEIPDNARRGLPVQIHLADPDRFAPREEVETWQAAAARSSIAAEIFKYSGAGHLYTDPTLPDHDAATAELTWSRVIASSLHCSSRQAVTPPETAGAFPSPVQTRRPGKPAHRHPRRG